MVRYSDEMYVMGACDIFAIASYRMLGYPIYVVRGFYMDRYEDEEHYEDCHLAVKIDDDLYYDVQGLKTEDDLRDNCEFSHNIKRIEFVEITEKEAMRALECETPTEDDIDDATLIVAERFPMEMKKTHPPPSPGRYEPPSSC